MATVQELILQRDDLARQLASVEQQIDEARRVERLANIEKARALLAELGLTPDDLGNRSREKQPGPPKSGKARGKAPIKYRHPQTGDAWSGRGLQPRWLRAAVANGAKLEDFAVKSA